MMNTPQSPAEQGESSPKQGAYELAVKMTDQLIDTIERTEDELDALRALMRGSRGLLGNSQADLIQSEIAILSALLEIRLCRFKTLGKE